MPNPNVLALAELLCDATGTQSWQELCEQYGDDHPAKQHWVAYAERLASQGVLVIAESVLTDEVVTRLPAIPRSISHKGKPQVEADAFRAALSRLAKGEPT